jgi:hypothetical protein
MFKAINIVASSRIPKNRMHFLLLAEFENYLNIHVKHPLIPPSPPSAEIYKIANAQGVDLPTSALRQSFPSLLFFFRHPLTPVRAAVVKTVHFVFLSPSVADVTPSAPLVAELLLQNLFLEDLPVPPLLPPS